MISYRLNRALTGDHEKIYSNIPDSVSSSLRDSRWKAYIKTIEALLMNDKRVFLAFQAPELPRNIKRLLSEIDANESIHNLKGVSREWCDQRTQLLQNHLAELPKDAIIVDPANEFCNKDWCFAVKQRTALYFDDDHMSVEGASLIAKEIIHAWRDTEQHKAFSLR